MSTPYIGEIRLMAFGSRGAPSGWEPCDGRLLNIGEYDTLFALIGTTYGGDGQTTFAVPDLRGRIPIHMDGSFIIGSNAGDEQTTLTVNQMPAHTHPAGASENAGDQTTPEGGLWADSGMSQYASGPANAAMRADLIGATGGSQPHTNMMPYLCVQFIIATQGIFPSPA